MATSNTIQTNRIPEQIERCCSIEIYIIHLDYCGNFQQDYHINGVIFGQKVSINDQNGVLVKSEVLFARIRPAKRPLTMSGPFTGFIIV